MMWPRRRFIFWWLVSAALVSACTAWAALRWHVRADHESGTAAKSSAPTLIEWLHSHADLSADQSEKLTRLEDSYQKIRNPLLGAILAAEAEIAMSMRAGGEPSATIPGALDRLSAARKSLQQAAVDHFFAVRKILNPSQRDTFAQWNDARLLHP